MQARSSFAIAVRERSRPYTTAPFVKSSDSGVFTYFAGSGSSSCRWGDYAGASPDPTCRGQVYGANGLNGATSVGQASWATQNFQLKVRTCPTASFTVTPTSPVHGSPATTNGSASNSPNGSIVKWAWKFGDGTTATTTTPTVNHTYTTAGTKKVALTVTDSVGLTGTTSKTITVS